MTKLKLYINFVISLFVVNLVMADEGNISGYKPGLMKSFLCTK